MNMNLDSIHRLIEETQIFQMQSSSMKARGDVTTPPTSPLDTRNSSFSFYGGQSHTTSNFRTHSLTTNKWDVCEELRLRELEEAKARAAQMEKTMRWWSDCTANWRDKWSKVRAERNIAMEEVRQLRVKLEMTMKELSTLKKKQRLSLQKEVSKANATQDPELPKFLEGSCDQSPWAPYMTVSIPEYLVKRQMEEEDTNNKDEGVFFDPLRVNEEMKLKPESRDISTDDSSRTCALSPGPTLETESLHLKKEVTESPASQVHLAHCQKILWKEREMRAALEKEIEGLEAALALWKWKYEELKKSKAASLKEFDVIRGQHENVKEGTSGDIQEGSEFQSSKDKVICEVRVKDGRSRVSCKPRLT